MTTAQKQLDDVLLGHPIETSCTKVARPLVRIKRKSLKHLLFQAFILAPYAELDTIRRNYRTALTRSYNSFQSITFFPVIPDFIMHAQKKDAHELYMQLIRPIVI